MKSAAYKDKNKCILQLIIFTDETGVDEVGCADPGKVKLTFGEAAVYFIIGVN